MTGIFCAIVLTLLLFGGVKSHGQSHYDSTYIRSFKHYLLGRFYLSKKFTQLNFRHRYNDYRLRYTPNTTLNMGLGATYKWATLNLAYGFGFLNPEHNRGDTRYLDLQFHFYGNRFTLDMLGQFYTGFYLPKDKRVFSSDDYYIRPDLRVSAIGGSLQYIFNHSRFSYRAAYLQNEWQKKSAGSFLAGIELYGGRVSADSSIVPYSFIQDANAGTVEGIRFIKIGPNGGYAYTWVYKGNFFISGTAVISLNAGVNRIYSKEGTSTYVELRPNTLFRISVGYNFARWSINVGYVSTALYFSGERTNSVTIHTGNYRLNLVYRFYPSKKVKRYLNVVDEVSDEIKIME